MKKPLKITLISVLIFLLLAGTTFSVLYFCRPKGQARSDIAVSSNNNTYIEGNTKNIAECSPAESLFILAFNLKKSNSYYAVISGEVNAGGIYKQAISGAKYKSGEDALYISRSTSFLKNTADQIFIRNDAVLVRKGDPKTNVFKDAVTEYSLNEYIDEYGLDFRELSNYELNENNITKAELVSAVDGLYTFRYEINVETGVKDYRVNMYKMGGLSELPTFSKSTLEVVMTENFMPKTITQIDEYKVNMVFTLSCKSTLVETFETINDDSVIIPEHEFFVSKLDG